MVPVVKKLLLMRYYNWLQFSRIGDIRTKTREWDRKCYGRAIGNTNISYDYIEKLLEKPIGDFRKFCIWEIFVPYFINVKRLSRLETFNITKHWLDGCNSLQRLNFNLKQKIDYSLDHVGSYWPPHLDKLKEGHAKLYERLEKEGKSSTLTPICCKY
jgi:hypothetical protein